MMNTTYETYMNALKQGLASFDSAAAEEILNDFESHFADARSQGLSDEEICAELGNVDDVLEFFRQEYATTKQPVANVPPQEKTHSNSEETHPNYPYAPSTAITAMEISLRNASADFAPGTSASVEFDFSGDFDPDRFEAGIEGNTFCLREKKLIPPVFWKHLFCNNHQKEVFSFQVPSTVQKLTLRSLNGATGLDTLSLTTLEISATNGKITGDSLSASSCRIQAANGKIVLTRLRTDSLDVSATNGKLEITGDCSRASLNSVNGKVLFEGTCSEYLTAKSVNGSVKLHLPHDLADASIHGPALRPQLLAGAAARQPDALPLQRPAQRGRYGFHRDGFSPRLRLLHDSRRGHEHPDALPHRQLLFRLRLLRRCLPLRPETSGPDGCTEALLNY